MCFSDCQLMEIINSPQTGSAKHHLPPSPCRTLVNRLNGFGVGAVKCRYGPSPRLSCYRPLGSSGGLMYFDLYHEPQNLLLPIKTNHMDCEQQQASHKPLLLSARFALTSSSPYKHSFLSIHTIARQEWGRLKFNRYNPYIHNK